MYNIINFFFYLINKVSKTIYLTPNFRSFGNAAEEIYYGILLAKKKNKKVFFIYPRKILFFSPNVPNIHLFSIESDLISTNQDLKGIILGKLLTLYILFLEFSRTLLYIVNLILKNKTLARHINDRNYIIPTIGKNQLWNPNWRGSFSWDEADRLNWAEQHLSFQPPLIPFKIASESLEYLKNFGFSETDWFSCVHSTNHINSPRNSDISTYTDAVNHIIEKGGWVFRIGSPSKDKLAINSKRYIDLTEYPNRCTALDLYLLSKCRYYIGNASGPKMVASLFRRNILGVNCTEWMMGLTQNIHDVHLLKSVFSKQSKQKLSLFEVLNLGLESQAYEETNPHDLTYEQNTPSQILNSLLILFEDSRSEEPDQIEIARKSTIRKIITNDLLIPWKGLNMTDNVAQKYRISAMSSSKCKLIYPR